MIPLPLPCKLQRGFTGQRGISTTHYQSNGNEDVHIVELGNHQSTKLPLTYPHLTIPEYQQVYATLLSCKGSERISYAGYTWRLTDGFTAEIYNAYVKLSFTLETVQ